MNAVLLSEKPKWAELIANGIKKYDVRKTRPKIDTPFKVFIYATKAKNFDEILIQVQNKLKLVDGRTLFIRPEIQVNGKVIGEFVCDRITKHIFDDEVLDDGYVCNTYWGLECWLTALTDEQVNKYGKGKPLYGWHISDLKIYDKPKQLSDFIKPSNGCCNEGKCKGCKFLDIGIDGIIEDDCLAEFDTDSYSIVKRPPQSWCYVKEVK